MDLETPIFPDDFRVYASDGGASYWGWFPDASPDYDGMWPIDGDPPQGLMIGDEATMSHELRGGGVFVVSWEYGPETESGPWQRRVYDEHDPGCVQRVVAEVMCQVRGERDVAARL